MSQATQGGDPLPLQLDVISDVMCPWCYIGYRRLKNAQAEAASVPLSVRWRPFQLDPTIPAEGMDRKTYLERKFGDGERTQQIYGAIKAEGEREGIDFQFDRIKKAPNTLDAHRVIHWSAAMGADVQDRAVARLFALYFEEGADLTDHAVLADAAQAAGMERPVVEQLLSGDADREEVEAQIAQAQQIGVQGVPFFLIDSKYGVSGAQPSEVLADAFQKIDEARRSPDGAAEPH